jgi:hypothetical protein
METILAGGGLTIKAHNGQYGVFLDNREVDWFATRQAASKLAQDLFASAKVANVGDPLIGTRRWCPTAVGNGQNVVVVAKSEHGYFVQPVGTSLRLEVSADILSEPIAYESLFRGGR